MHVDVECKNCHAKYRVPATLAGRKAQCKHCGQKFIVPHLNAASEPADDAAPAFVQDDEPTRKKRNIQHLRPDETPDDTGPKREDGFVNDLLALQAIEKEEEDRRKKKFGGEQDPTFQALPPLVTDLWIPLALLIIGYGISLYVAITNILEGPGKTAGFILLGVVALLYFVLVMPLTMKMMESAASTLNFGLANAAWLQTIALFSIPTAGMTIGFFSSGWLGLVAGLIIGLAIMMPLAMVVYRVSIMTAVQAVVLASLLYVLALAGDIAVMVGVAFLLVPMWHLPLPWQTATTEVATMEQKTTEAPKPSTPAAVVAAVPKPAPVVEEKIEIVKTPENTGPVWNALIDPLAQPAKWPASVHHLIPVKPPVVSVHAMTKSPFVALFDKDSCDIYDLRKGSRTGGVKTTMRSAGALLSPDGQLLAVMRPPQAIDIWSMALGKHVGKISADIGSALPKPLAFVANNRLLTSGTTGGEQVYQVWDTGTGQVLRTIEVPTANDFALSHGGRVLITLRPGKLTAIDLEEGVISGEADVEPIFFTIKGLDVSPDGSKLAAVVAENGPPRLLVFDLADGKLLHEHAVATGASAASVRGTNGGRGVIWTPDNAGVVVDRAMYDAATGKSLYTFNVPPIAGVEGVPVDSPSIYAVMYEYQLPVSGDRLVFKTANAPRGDLETAIKRVRGDAWQPPAETGPVAEVASTGPTEAVALRPTADFNVAELVRQGEWELKVVSIAKADPDAIGEQIKVEQAKLPELERKFSLAVTESKRMEEYESYSTPEGVTKRRRKYSEKQIGDANVAELRTKRDFTTQKALVMRLTREQEAAINTRTLVAQLTTMENGPQVIVNVEGDHLLATVDAMTPGAAFRVAGKGRFIENALRVESRVIVPMP